MTLHTDKSPIHSFVGHCLGKYGLRVGKIALDAGVICPNRARGGCVYCSPKSFTPFYLEKGDDLALQLAKGKTFLARKGLVKYLAYFQQETTTAAPINQLMNLFEQAVSDVDCVGLVVSTRPDYVAEDFLCELARLARERAAGKEILIELGLQSAHDKTLRLLNRNHTLEDFVLAVRRLKRYDFIQVGVHLILGLPGEDETDMLATVKNVCNLGVDAIKFHHLQIIRGTKLLAMYRESPFKVYEAPEYLGFLARLLSFVPWQVVIHRLWSTASAELLFAPQWKLPPHKLSDLLFRIMAEQQLYQGKNA